MMNQRILVIVLGGICLLLCLAVIVLLMRGGTAGEVSGLPSTEEAVAQDLSSGHHLGSRGIGGVTDLAEDTNGTATRPSQSPTNIPTPLQQDTEAIRLEHERGLQDQQQQIQLAFDSLRSAVGDFAGFSAGLARLAKKYPKSSTASSFREVSVEAPLWKAVQDWSQLRKQAGDQANLKLSPEKARQLVSQADRMIRSASIEEYAQWFDHSREHLMSITGRVDFGGQRMDEGLKRFLDEPLMGDVVLVEDFQTKQQYYLKNMAAIESPVGTKVPFYYIVDHDLSVRRGTITKGQGRHVAPAPHCTVAQEIRDRLHESENLSSDWDRVFLELLEMILSSKDASPFPKLAIYRETLGVACNGSATMGEAFQDHLRDLQAARIDRNAKWFDPNDRDGRIASQEARKVLTNLTSIAVIRSKMRKSIESLSATGAAPVQWIGFLGKTADGKWKAVGVDGSQNDGALFVVARDQNLIAHLVPIGKLVQGEVQWVADELLVEGRPLFKSHSVQNVSQ